MAQLEAISKCNCWSRRRRPHLFSISRMGERFSGIVTGALQKGTGCGLRVPLSTGSSFGGSWDSTSGAIFAGTSMPMSPHETHQIHPHAHAPGCGHPMVRHGGHQDYAHDGHLHHPHEGHVDEHAIEVSRANPDACTPAHACGRHAVDHEHGVGCGHHALPHGDHVDFVVDGHLHHPCSGHCDDHGPVTVTP